MKKRIFWSILLTSFFILALTTTVILRVVYNQFSKERKSEIKTEIEYIAEAFSGENIDYLENIGKTTKNRITLILSDGTVAYDNFASIDTIENHKNRPEIKDAKIYGYGEITRSSDTLGEKTYYYAKSLPDGSVIRVAVTINTIKRLIGSTIVSILLIILLALVFAIIMARIFTRRIVKPINTLNLENPLENTDYDELSPLLVRMDKQNKKISQAMRELSLKQKEFEDITENMSEGLVVFSSDKNVLSANNSAEFIFSNYNSEGISYLEFCRDSIYIKLVEYAFDGKACDGKLERDGRIYRLSVTPVKGAQNYAVVLFAIDITEAEKSEQLRREFSANVSHELKTPLTSILGCAEIMQNKIAKPKDFPRFTGQIYSEAKRLLSLIEDIIKLSKLDESELKNEFAPVNLFEVAKTVVSELSYKAENKSINVSLTGDNLSIDGIENTLHEIIYNLCDNAIIYNNLGGEVNIKIYDEDNHTVICVADNGIGIKPENQSRIFERFYRVDKSHSKETGGTGLGLSIVKHGAMLHNAKVELTSAIGKGTEIKLIF